jgi:hypothetical protein
MPLIVKGNELLRVLDGLLRLIPKLFQPLSSGF